MTAEPLMRGFTSLREYIAAFLAAEVPALIDVARLEWAGVDALTLPYPEKYDWYDLALVNQYPAIGLVPANDKDHRRTDITDHGAKEIWTNYATRIFVIAASPLDANGQFIGDGKASALRLRDDLLRLVQAALLDYPNLKRTDVKLVEESMVTDYLEPMKVNTQNPRWAAAGIISVDFRFMEYTRSLKYGNANTVVVEELKLVP